MVHTNITDEQLLAEIAASPKDDALRIAYANSIATRDPIRSEMIRLQCELAGMTEKNPGWYPRKYRLAHLTRGNSPLISMMEGDNNECRWLAELRALRHNGKPIGAGSFERGFVGRFSSSNADGFRASAEQLFRLAPLITSFEFSDLDGTQLLYAIKTCWHAQQTEALHFQKCQFTDSELISIFDLPELKALKRIKDRTVNGTFASIASVRRGPAALRSPLRRASEVPHEPQQTEKTKLTSRLPGRILPAAQTACDSPSVRERDCASRSNRTCRQRR